MKTYLVAETFPNWDGVNQYLTETNQYAFTDDIREAEANGVPISLCLCSMFAKLCYKSLVPGKNENVTKTRSIADNIKSVIDSGHGSVLEHVWFSFITTGCSRVFTHELVRHRVGTAFSQTSGRYVSIDELDMVLPPELENDDHVAEIIASLELELRNLRKHLITDDMPFADKKRLTSAIRRLAPNGQSNEIAWSANLRALRHMIEMRTSPAAEWEIREVFMDVADHLLHPMYLYGGTRQEDGSWKGLRV